MVHVDAALRSCRVLPARAAVTPCAKRRAAQALPRQQQHIDGASTAAQTETRSSEQQPALTLPRQHRRGVLQGILGSATLSQLLAGHAAAGGGATTATPADGQLQNAPAVETASADAATLGAGVDAAAAGSLQGASSSSSRQGVSSAAAAGRDPAINQGCATTGAARQQLAGLIPPRTVDVSVEVLRAQAALARCSTDLEKHRLLVALKETNRTAFIALLQSNLEDVLPLVYTPTIAEACLTWGSLVPRPLGLYVTPDDDPLTLLQHWPSDEVAIAVITDGERVLGLGDLGAHGMGIPTGKASVYLAAATTPDWLLPITVDVGCDDAALTSDPLYVGLPQQRLRGPRYFEVMTNLVAALQQRFGRRVVVHWEDLAAGNAFAMLQALGLPTFNDDIQCTAAVVLAAVLGGCRVPGVPPLAQQTFLFFGAGQANLGVAQLLLRALQQQAGLSQAAARRRIWLVDSQGLITADRARAGLSPQKAAFARAAADLVSPAPEWTGGGSNGSSSSSSGGSSGGGGSSSRQLHEQLAGLVAATRATALIGAAAVPGAFGQPVIEALVKATHAAGGPSARPLVLALSNPTDKAEVSFSDALRWARGTAVFASGSPFPAVPVPGPGGRVLRPAQANNCYVFAGLAQGIIRAQAAAAAAAAGSDGGSSSSSSSSSGAALPQVDDECLLLVAQSIAGLLSQQELQEECVLPRISRLPEVTAAVAADVAAAMQQRAALGV